MPVTVSVFLPSEVNTSWGFIVVSSHIPKQCILVLPIILKKFSFNPQHPSILYFPCNLSVEEPETFDQRYPPLLPITVALPSVWILLIVSLWYSSPGSSVL